VDSAFDRVPFVRALTRADRLSLLPHTRVKTLEPGDACWTEGQTPEEFAFVIGGRIKMVKSSETGRETILEMGEAGDLLCGSAVFCFAPHCCASLALERGTQVLLVPRRQVLDLVERNPSAGRALMREITSRGLAMCKRVEELAAGQVDRRIALLLLKLADRAGVGQPDGATIAVPVRLTRQDIADLCGTTVETSIRVMSRLRKSGLVETTARGFVIRDRRGLEETARAHLHQLKTARRSST
jgi:CRP/FNR family transcriptional regulator